MNHEPSSPLILHIPHSSTYIPEDLRKSICLTDDELKQEKLIMVDKYADELFKPSSPFVQEVVFPVCRLVVDPERFVDDSMEIMAKNGMGVVYTRTEQGKPLRKSLTPENRRQLVERFYVPHHDKLSNLVGAALSEYDKCVIVDCHSFPSSPFSFEDESLDRPDICIGRDSFHTPRWLSDLVVQLFQQEGFSVATNTPFAGSFTPTKYFGKNKNVYSVMIEINRKLYMDEKTGEKNPNFESLQKTISRNIDCLFQKLKNNTHIF
jgi:N-formylglutamate amidohydrolase